MLVTVGRGGEGDGRNTGQDWFQGISVAARFPHQKYNEKIKKSVHGPVMGTVYTEEF